MRPKRVVMGRVAGSVVLVALALAGCTQSPLVGTGTGFQRVPAGWKTVTYHDVGIDVPAVWTVEPWHENCGVTAPTVFTGPAKPQFADCVALAGDASEVILGGLQFGQSGRLMTETINGLKALVTTSEKVFHGTLGATTTYEAVTLPTLGISISVYVGESSRVPGGLPGRAERVVKTIHATSKTPVTACLADPAWPTITLGDRLPRTMLTVPIGTVLVVNVPRWGFGRATDIGMSDTRVLQEQCSVLLADHGRRTILLAIAPGRSSLEATITPGSNAAMPAWLGTVVVNANANG
jgi:hypothetical protein